jgi:ParB family chromosome partitioning protein
MLARPDGRAMAGPPRAPHRAVPLMTGGPHRHFQQVPSGAVQMVALDLIDVADGFNPRSRRERGEFARLVASVRRYGVLQPVLLAPADEGRVRLVAGEGRYLAAVEGELEEIPALVRETDPETDGVELALIENLTREDLNAVDEARGYQDLLYRGLSIKGIAELLPKVPQRRISERLQILRLPEELHTKIADGRIPPRAVKALGRLAKIHPGLPAVAVGKVERAHRSARAASASDLGGRAEAHAAIPVGVDRLPHRHR